MLALDRIVGANVRHVPPGPMMVHAFVQVIVRLCRRAPTMDQEKLPGAAWH